MSYVIYTNVKGNAFLSLVMTFMNLPEDGRRHKLLAIKQINNYNKITIVLMVTASVV